MEAAEEIYAKQRLPHFYRATKARLAVSCTPQLKIQLTLESDVVRYTDLYNPQYVERPSTLTAVQPAAPYFPEELITGKFAAKLSSTFFCSVGSARM